MSDTSLDHGAFLGELRTILDDLNNGVGRRAILARIVTAAEQFGGGVAACFVVVEPGGGRVAVSSGSGAWMQGRHFPWEGSALADAMARGHRSSVYDVDEASESVRVDLRSRGIHSVVLALATVSNRTIGALEVFYPARSEPIDAVRRSVLELLAGACCQVIDTTPEHGRGDRGALGSVMDGGRGELTSAVAASIADGLAVLGRDGTVRSWNRAAQHLTGLAREAALRRPPPFPVPHAGQAVEHRLDSGRWIHVLCSSLGGTGERVITFRDVTRPKLVEEAKDLLLATTSHELRTPITVVKGYADTLLRRWSVLDDEQRLVALRVIQQRSTQLADLVERLLTGVKPSDEGAVRISRKPFDLASAVAEASVGLLDASPRHHLVVDMPDGLPPARGDRVSIGTVVAELVSNAAKYTPEGGEITITGGYEATAVMFCVADRGIGVRPEDVERVFDRFWQGEIGDQRRFGGVGLGLYIVRRLVDRQGGWVSLRPRDGGGTVVEVRLSRADRT